MSEPVPQWLAKWRSQHATQPRAQRIAAPRQGCRGEPVPVSAVAEAVRPAPPKANWQGFVIPEPWPDDGGKRREQVLDTDRTPPRVVRSVGWRLCMACHKSFWSDDVVAVRICDGCKELRDQRKSQRW